MEEELKFIYLKEYWYLSAFIKTEEFKKVNKEIENKKEEKIDINGQIEKIISIIKKKLNNLKKEDLFYKLGENTKNQVINLSKNISINCKWLSHIKNFPYNHENIDEDFDELGSLEFQVEYFKDNDEKKTSITPLLIQQIPYIVKDLVTEFSYKTENKYLYIDEESPIYIFVISTETRPGPPITWSSQNISKFKKVIGSWTEIYSGSWADYSETLYEKRVKNNLSNRKSELHFLRRNSGLIYMEKENYKNYFDYMYKTVLINTAKLRAISFALLSIDDSLDTITCKKRVESVLGTEKSLNEKITNLKKIKNFRESIQENMSEFIFNELVLNRRQHETAVLEHLMSEFKINETYNRIFKKFDMIYGEMQDIALKHQLNLRQSMDRLNILIIAGVLADFINFLIGAFSAFNTAFLIINLMSSVLMLLFLGYVVYRISKIRKSELSEKIQKLNAVVGIVLDKERKRILITKRANRPFKKKLSLPGCYIEKKENPEIKLAEEVEEETASKIYIEKKLGESLYKPEVDVKTFVYLCSLESDPDKITPGGNALEAELIPIEKLKGIDLAFDHEIILKKEIFSRSNL